MSDEPYADEEFESKKNKGKKKKQNRKRKLRTFLSWHESWKLQPRNEP